MSKKSIIWKVFQTNALRDYGLNSSKDEIKEIKNNLEEEGFYFVCLNHNMHNSSQIYKTIEGAKHNFPLFESIQCALDQLSSTINSNVPVNIPLKINDLPIYLGPAIAYAMGHCLNVIANEEYKNMVIIYELYQGSQSKKIVKALRNAGVKDDYLSVYYPINFHDKTSRKEL